MTPEVNPFEGEMLERLRVHFPVAEKTIYMNHAGVGPLTTDMMFAIQNRTEQVMERGDADMPNWIEDLNSCRAMYAELVGARPEEIALIDSTCQGVNMIANGIAFKSGENVVCADVEYPANVYPWWNLKGQGVETRMVSSKEGRLATGDLLGAMDAHTRVLALSFVEFTNGFRNDLATLGGECRKRGVRLFVDAIQGLGALKVDVREMGIDFLASGSKKWLLCPGGKGVLYVRNELLDELRVSTVGADSVVNAEEYLKYDLTFVAGARRFEGSMDDPIAYAATRAGLAMFIGLGMDIIEKRVMALTDRLCEGLLKAGCTLDSPRGQDEKSGIVAFHHGKLPSEELAKRLRRATVTHTQRYGMIRLSPHFYNSEEEIDTVVKAVSK